MWNKLKFGVFYLLPSPVPHGISANNFAMKAKRKTLNATDVMAAMEEMEFERFLQPLKEALEGECGIYNEG